MCVTDCHDLTLAVKVALNPNTTSLSFVYNLLDGPNNNASPSSKYFLFFKNYG